MIEITMPYWISRPEIRRAGMVKYGRGHRSFEGTGRRSKVYVIGPLRIAWTNEIVIKNAVVERYERIMQIRLDKR